MPQVNVPLNFPLKGVAESAAYGRTPKGTTLNALNVRGFDPLTGRFRGGKRPGTSRVIAEQVAQAAHPVQRMRQITLSAGTGAGSGNISDPDYSDNGWGGWDDPFADVGSGEDGDGFAGGFLRPEPTYNTVINWPDPDPDISASISAGSLAVASYDRNSVSLSFGTTTGGTGVYAQRFQIQQVTMTGPGTPAYPLGTWVDLGAIASGDSRTVSGLDSGETYKFQVTVAGYVWSRSLRRIEAAATTASAQQQTASILYLFNDSLAFSATDWAGWTVASGDNTNAPDSTLVYSAGVGIVGSPDPATNVINAVAAPPSAPSVDFSQPFFLESQVSIKASSVDIGPDGVVLLAMNDTPASNPFDPGENTYSGLAVFIERTFSGGDAIQVTVISGLNSWLYIAADATSSHKVKVIVDSSRAPSLELDGSSVTWSFASAGSVIAPPGSSAGIQVIEFYDDSIPSAPYPSFQWFDIQNT